MLNALDIVRGSANSKKFVIGDLLFARLTCPVTDIPIGVWSQMDQLVHVLSARSSWRTSRGTWTLEPGQTAFLLKGAFIIPPRADPDSCILLFFIPDAFVRETVRGLASNLPPLLEAAPDPREFAILVNNDAALLAFFRSMVEYFAADESPPEALLKLKLAELVTSILLGRSNPRLSAYLRSVSSSDAPSIPAIMEANFTHHLSMEEFAQLCHRSLSSFKRDFQKQFGMPPGRWLLERRLQCAAELLHKTELSVTDIVFECGFEETAHFSRSFRAKFGVTPTEYRDTQRCVSSSTRPSVTDQDKPVAADGPQSR